MNFGKILLNWLGRYSEKSSSEKEILRLIKKLNPVRASSKLIRLGDKYDGGYILPNDLKGVKYCFSAGVGDLIKFEQDCFVKYKIKSFLCDFNNIKDPKIIKFFDFTRKKISSYNDHQTITIDNWIDKKITSDKKDLILKIDIEGNELEVLLNLSEKYLKRTRFLIVEFHNLRDLRNKSFYKIFDNVISRLLNFFYIVHLHPNNAGENNKIHTYNVPDFLEVTFVRKDRIKKIKKYNNILPLKIDERNVENKKDILLDSYWYQAN